MKLWWIIGAEVAEELVSVGYWVKKNSSLVKNFTKDKSNGACIMEQYWAMRENLA